MDFPVYPEFPIAPITSLQTPTGPMGYSAPSMIHPESTYKSGKVVQTNGATSYCQTTAQTPNHQLTQPAHADNTFGRRSAIRARNSNACAAKPRAPRLPTNGSYGEAQWPARPFDCRGVSRSPHLLRSTCARVRCGSAHLRIECADEIAPADRKRPLQCV